MPSIILELSLHREEALAELGLAHRGSAARCELPLGLAGQPDVAAHAPRDGQLVLCVLHQPFGQAAREVDRIEPGDARHRDPTARAGLGAGAHHRLPLVARDLVFAEIEQSRLAVGRGQRAHHESVAQIVGVAGVVIGPAQAHLPVGQGLVGCGRRDRTQRQSTAAGERQLEIVRLRLRVVKLARPGCSLRLGEAGPGRQQQGSDEQPLTHRAGPHWAGSRRPASRPAVLPRKPQPELRRRPRRDGSGAARRPAARRPAARRSAN